MTDITFTVECLQDHSYATTEIPWQFRVTPHMNAPAIEIEMNLDDDFGSFTVRGLNDHAKRLNAFDLWRAASIAQQAFEIAERHPEASDSTYDNFHLFPDAKIVVRQDLTPQA